MNAASGICPAGPLAIAIEGLCYAGKTTLARLLARLAGAVVISEYSNMTGAPPLPPREPERCQSRAGPAPRRRTQPDSSRTDLRCPGSAVRMSPASAAARLQLLLAARRRITRIGQGSHRELMKLGLAAGASLACIAQHDHCPLPEQRVGHAGTADRIPCGFPARQSESAGCSPARTGHARDRALRADVAHAARRSRIVRLDT